VTRLHLRALCCLAVRQAPHRCPPPLPTGPGGAPRRYSEESLLLIALLLIALLRTLWRLSPRALTDWLRAWPALVFACGLPARDDGTPWVPCPSQQWTRAARAGAPPCETLFVLVVTDAIRRRVIGARDLIIDSAPIRPGTALAAQASLYAVALVGGSRPTRHSRRDRRATRASRRASSTPARGVASVPAAPTPSRSAAWSRRACALSSVPRSHGRLSCGHGRPSPHDGGRASRRTVIVDGEKHAACADQVRCITR